MLATVLVAVGVWWGASVAPSSAAELGAVKLGAVGLVQAGEPVTATTRFCYALAEPYKHWPLYLEVTRQLDTCTHNWYTARQFLEEPRHTPSIWNHVYRPSMRDLVMLADDFPGRTWLLYNEPELPMQANTTPGDAAIHARYWTEAIGEEGRTGCCGVSVDERLPWDDWLDGFLAAGGPVPDVWHIHIYAETPAVFERRLGLWWGWYAEHGEGLPTIISEVGFGMEMYEYMSGWQHEGVPEVYWFGLVEPTAAMRLCVGCSSFIYVPLAVGDAAGDVGGE